MTSDLRRVLVVEDNPDNQYLVTLLLEAEGYVVRLAADGREAIAYAAEGGYDFVLLDLQLPDSDGFEVARRIRAVSPVMELPLIVVSAADLASARKEARLAGCCGYIEKPIDADQFVAQVRGLAGVAV